MAKAGPFRRALLLSLLATALLTACSEGGTGPANPRIRLATTTSTDNSGLLDAILPPFEEATGYRVHVVAVGTGQALALGRRGDADLVLVHARAHEDAFVAEGHGIDRRDVFWNDFVVLGPADDPAGVRGMDRASEALQRIAETGARFVSRGDDSGTHTRERLLWKGAGGRPTWPAYVEKGDGMGPCLTHADEKLAYVLADRGTWLSRRAGLDLVVLVEGDPALHNPYGAILVNPARHDHVNVEGAKRLLEYLTSAEGSRRVAAFRVDGEVLFHAPGGA